MNDRSTHPADVAAEAIRDLNHLTLARPTPTTPGWEDLSDIYRAVGALSTLVQRLPQALGQVANAVEAGTYRSDDGSDPDDLRELIAIQLRETGPAIDEVRTRLESAHTMLSHLAATR